jgi:hypothetical protein
MNNMAYINPFRAEFPKINPLKEIYGRTSPF